MPSPPGHTPTHTVSAASSCACGYWLLMKELWLCFEGGRGGSPEISENPRPAGVGPPDVSSALPAVFHPVAPFSAAGFSAGRCSAERVALPRGAVGRARAGAEGGRKSLDGGREK